MFSHLDNLRRRAARRLHERVAGRLWGHADFLKLWGGQSVSSLGTAVTTLALPTAAIVLLGARPFEVGALNAAQSLAYPVLGLLAGVWCDRWRRRRVLIASNLGRMLVLATVPVAYFTGVLSLWQLFPVALLVGVGQVFFEVAYRSYLPVLIGRKQLLEGNARLQASDSMTQVAGPALAGFLIQAVRAAPAILADSFSYLVAVGSLLLIRAPEPPPMARAPGRGRFRQELSQGIRVTLGHPIIRPIACAAATSNFGWQIVWAVYLVYAYRDLHLSAGVVGAISAVGSLGAVVGAMAAMRVVRWLGLGLVMAGATAVYGIGELAIPLASLGHPVAVLGGVVLLASICSPIANITMRSMRQGLVEDNLQGRANATVQTVSWSIAPLGAIVGGVLGSRLGVVPTIVVGGGVALLALGWVLSGPVRVRDQPGLVVPP